MSCSHGKTKSWRNTNSSSSQATRLSHRKKARTKTRRESFPPLRLVRRQTEGRGSAVEEEEAEEGAEGEALAVAVAQERMEAGTIARGRTRIKRARETTTERAGTIGRWHGDSQDETAGKAEIK